MDSQQIETYLACRFCFPNVCHMMFSSKFALETDLDQYHWLKESLPPDKIALEKKDEGYFEGAVNDLGGLLSCCSTLLKCIDIFSKHVKKNTNKQTNIKMDSY